MIPTGSIADHIRIDDGKPVYFPGTYNVLEQGNKTFGMVPAILRPVLLHSYGL